jgi:iron complex transport system ATP-binding protein
MLLSEGGVVEQGLLDDVLNEKNLSLAFHQQIALDKVDGRYFARRKRRAGGHRRRSAG